MSKITLIKWDLWCHFLLICTERLIFIKMSFLKYLPITLLLVELEVFPYFLTFQLKNWGKRYLDKPMTPKDQAPSQTSSDLARDWGQGDGLPIGIGWLPIGETCQFCWGAVMGTVKHVILDSDQLPRQPTLFCSLLRQNLQQKPEMFKFSSIKFQNFQISFYKPPDFKIFLNRYTNVSNFTP